MPHVSIRVSEQEKNQIENYAKLQGLNLSEAIKSVFFSKLEDEFDINLIREYESEPNKATYSHEEVKQLLGL